jgi:hypothetical protein
MKPIYLSNRLWNYCRHEYKPSRGPLVIEWWVYRRVEMVWQNAPVQAFFYSS